MLWEAQFGDFVNSAQVDHRPVHRLRAGQVGPDHAPDAAAAARLRGLGPRALLGPPGALPDARRRGQHPRGEPHDAGPVLPPAAPPGARGQAAPAGDHDPEVAAAPAAGDLADRAPLRGALLPRAGRAAHRRGQGHPPRALHRQGLLRPQGPRDAREQRGRGDLPRRAALPLPAGADHGGGHALPEPARGRLGPGGAAQHGRPRAHVAAPAADAPDQLEFGYVGRPERATPGEGYPAAHTMEQNRIIRTALDLSIPVSVNPAKQPGER